MRVLAPLAALLLAASLTGCLGAFSMPPIRIDMGSSFGASASLSSLRVEPSYDPLAARLDVRVAGSVRTDALVEDVTVHLHLVEGPCPMGPTGDPQRWADREDVLVGDVNGTAPFDATLSAAALPGTPWSVYARVDPSGLGPSFASCRNVAAIPAAPAADLLAQRRA